MNEYFDKICCLNQDTRPDRWEQVQAEFKRFDIKAERFASIPADQPNKSFCLSQYAMLKKFLQTDGQTLLALEDDVVFRNISFFDNAMKELPNNWHILYLGANITDGVFGIKENPPQKISGTDRFVRVSRAWTTHAIAYRRIIVEKIVRAYPVHTFEMYDNWLSENMLFRCNAYLVNPMVAYQRPGKSDLWGGIQTDYTGAFEWGNKFMQS
jgi:hypothetical protein